MARFSPAATLLFWIMVLLAGSLLAPCVILPAWLEYQAALEMRASAERRIATLEQRLTVAQVQIEHLKNDPAYIERLARKEFGIMPPGVETVIVTPPTDSGQQNALPGLESGGAAESGGGADPQTEDELVPELSALVRKSLERYPLAQIFVLDRTRWVLMAMGAVLLLAAIFLVGGPGRAGAPAAPRPADRR